MEQSMKIDGNKVRALRESRAWSQEQLATASGLSVRTVQRAESESSASRETRVCLAAALGIDHSDLNPSSEPIHSSQPSDAAGRRGAKDEADLILRVTGGAFVWCGASMLLMLVFVGGWGMGSPVLWIGFFSLVSGSALYSAALGRRRLKSQAHQVV